MVRCPLCKKDDETAKLLEGIPDEIVKFCPVCGTNLKFECPACGEGILVLKDSSDDFSYRCKKCGSLFHLCENCGRPVDPNSDCCDDVEKCKKARIMAPEIYEHISTGSGFWNHSLVHGEESKYEHDDFFTAPEGESCFGASLANGLMFIWHGEKSGNSSIDAITTDYEFAENLNGSLQIGDEYCPSSIRRTLISFADVCVIAASQSFAVFNNPPSLCKAAEISDRIVYDGDEEAEDESDWEDYEDEDDEGPEFTPVDMIAGHSGAALWGKKGDRQYLYTIPNPKRSESPEVKRIKLPDEKSTLKGMAMGHHSIYWLDSSGSIYSCDVRKAGKVKKIETGRSGVEFIWTDPSKSKIDDKCLEFAFKKNGKLMKSDENEGEFVVNDSDMVSEIFSPPHAISDKPACKSPDNILSISLNGQSHQYKGCSSIVSRSIMAINSKSGRPCIISLVLEEETGVFHPCLYVQFENGNADIIWRCREKLELKDLICNDKGDLFIVHENGVKKIYPKERQA